MHVEEEKKLDVLIKDIPVGGVFKSISGKTFMKITEQDIKAVDLGSGFIYNFSSEAKVEYFANARVILEH